jgi:hypothetical protein
VINDYVPCELTPAQDAQMRFQKTAETALLAEATRQFGLKRIRDLHAFNKAMRSSPDFDTAFKNAEAYIEDGDATRAAVRGDFQKKIAETNTGAAKAPRDIACSQSLLPWEEAADIFGRRVANTYLVFQVVVRNLSPDNEFVMHDVKIALNDPHSTFVSGRDKMLARGVALRGQSDDVRNVVIRVGDAIASIAGASSVAFTGVDFKNAVSIFSSAFLPGLKSVYPDYTIDQLNRLNDLAFSSSNAYKIVIPKSGSAPFVTFLPAKIFAGDGKAEPLPYRKWPQPRLLAFSNSAFVIVAGVHVKEIDDTPSLSKLDCPHNGDGTLDLAGAKGDTFTCDASGANLDQVTKLRLENSKESNDKATADATLTAAKDKTSGKAAFKLADLNLLKAEEYTVYLVTDAPAPAATSVTVTLKQAN